MRSLQGCDRKHGRSNLKFRRGAWHREMPRPSVPRQMLLGTWRQNCLDDYRDIGRLQGRRRYDYMEVIGRVEPGAETERTSGTRSRGSESQDEYMDIFGRKCREQIFQHILEHIFQTGFIPDILGKCSMLCSTSCVHAVVSSTFQASTSRCSILFQIKL